MGENKDGVTVGHAQLPPALCVLPFAGGSGSMLHFGETGTDTLIV